MPLPIAPMMRGRHSLAILGRAGATDTVVSTAEEYIALAAQLGVQPDQRAAISEKVIAAHDALFENLESVRGLESFLINL